jgi:hypothetical protein
MGGRWFDDLFGDVNRILKLLMVSGEVTPAYDSQQSIYLDETDSTR